MFQAFSTQTADVHPLSYVHLCESRGFRVQCYKVWKFSFMGSGILHTGHTVAGIVVGVLLLAIPFSFILSVALMLTFAVFFGRLVEYKEIRFKPHLEDGSHPQPTTPPPISPPHHHPAAN